MKDLLTQTFRPVAAFGRGIRRLIDWTPIDLVGVAAFVAVATTLLVVRDVTSPVVRAAVGFPLLFLAPGYAVVSTLFPRSAPLETTDSRRLIGQTRRVSDAERVALAFGLSVAILPLLGVTIATLSRPFTTSVVVRAVSWFALAGLAVGAVRRFRVPAQDRYRVRLARKLGAVREGIFAGSPLNTAVNVILVVSVLVAVTSVGYALAAPQQGEQYTSLQLLTEDDSGELVAADYPSEIEPGESISMTIAVENREGEDTEYTVVIQEQWVDDGEVFERVTLQEIEYRVDDGMTAYGDREITPEAESGTVRIAVLLYEDEVPETPTTENAYRHGYFWTEIEESVEAE